jgi:hypothetical protein
VKRFFFVPFLATIVFGSLFAAIPLNADEPITVSVWPSIAVARGNAQLKVFVQRNDANRTLSWEVDGPDYYRSSTMQLEGASAPKSWFFFVHDLPEGVFAVRATVRRNNDSESVALTRITVMPGMAR